MPFSEEDLRAMLTERSKDVPVNADLSAKAEHLGRRLRTRRRVVGGVLAACVIAGAALAVPSFLEGGAEQPAPPIATPSGGTPRSGLDVSSLRGTTYTRVYADTPAELAEHSEAVVIGSIEMAIRGPVKGYGDNGADYETVLQVRVERKIKGSDEYVAGGRVYIDVDPEWNVLGSKVPPGTRLIAFLSEYSVDEDFQKKAREEGAGGSQVPEDSVLMCAHPQGLVFENPSPASPGLTGGHTDLKLQGPEWQATTIDQIAGRLER